MIQSGRASLTVVSRETEPTLISEILGLEPTSMKLRGSASRSGRLLDHNVWTMDIDHSRNTEDDQTGTRALRELVAAARPGVGQFQLPSTDCSARIWWSADSDSTQGGFVLPVELAAGIAELGVDVYATVYLDDGSNSGE
ncbi:hypothetical protein [Agromyces allii]|uniref:DUF4279 domain-containing protein n=1 Tax=Agromyces allii TaxID=393607 RepID=A0ABP5BDG9_9MICO|nr:hypothetical protein [Agromyces allii]